MQKTNHRNRPPGLPVLVDWSIKGHNAKIGSGETHPKIQGMKG